MISLWETLGVLSLSLAGLGLGYWFSRLPKPWWTLGYFLPLLLIVAMGLTRRFSHWETVPPFAWLMAGRTEFALTGLLVPMILCTLLPRIPRRRERIALGVLMALAVLVMALLPFAAPIFNRAYLASLETKFDAAGVCRQSNDYTCGPAAAVTALKVLGVRAEEGRVAILARTTRWTGTEPDMLAAALRRGWSGEGIQAEYRHFQSIDEMRGPFVTIARIKYTLLIDHYVTILRVGENEILAADPMRGLEQWTRADFADRWRYCGVVLARTNLLTATTPP